jgi:hypothetical protein
MSMEAARPPGEEGKPLIVEDGRILAYRLFDVGDAIALDVGETCISRARERQRSRIAPEKGAGLLFATPPLDVPLGSTRVDLPAPFGPLDASVTVRLYDYGAVSLRYEIAIAPGTDLEAMIPLCDHLYDAPELDASGRALLADFLPEIRPAIEGAHTWQGVETYTVVFVRRFRADPTPKDVLASPVLLRLLLGERSAIPPLSELERTDVLQHAQSYYADDLVVVDWNSAFVLEPSGSRAIPDILEFANSQLLELRYYDDNLDAELARIYDDFAQARRNPLGLIWSPYGKLARNVLRRIIEVTEFTERVDNALKVVGDFYVARIYQGALRRLKIAAWQESVGQKMRLVERAYDLAKGEVEIRRSTVLEVIVIVLIVLELVAAIRGVH